MGEEILSFDIVIAKFQPFERFIINDIFLEIIKEILIITDYNYFIILGVYIRKTGLFDDKIEINNVDLRIKYEKMMKCEINAMLL